jgi:hypothetical protein
MPRSSFAAQALVAATFLAPLIAQGPPAVFASKSRAFRTGDQDPA